MRYLFTTIVIGIIASSASVWWFWLKDAESFKPSFLSPESVTSETNDQVSAGPTPKPFEKYTFNSLSNQKFPAALIEFKAIEVDPTPKPKVKPAEPPFQKRMFYYKYEGQTVSGLAHFPKGVFPDLEENEEESNKQQVTSNKEGKYPVIVMIRGYVDKEIYEPGVGTQRAGEVLAQNGYITLAPDFLGFGESDVGPSDVWEERFSRPGQVLSLLASLASVPQADPEKVGIWAHSNGGQIALSLLEITKKPYPTTLWAPVSKPFPYSVLYYTDESDDEGKTLRQEIARLEQDYDVRQYSITDYLSRITAPMVIHQGTADDAIPTKWSQQLVTRLKEEIENLDITYYEYPGADHNMAGSWNTVVERDLKFFSEQLKD